MRKCNTVIIVNCRKRVKCGGFSIPFWGITPDQLRLNSWDQRWILQIRPDYFSLPGLPSFSRFQQTCRNLWVFVTPPKDGRVIWWGDELMRWQVSKCRRPASTLLIGLPERAVGGGGGGLKIWILKLNRIIHFKIVSALLSHVFDSGRNGFRAFCLHGLSLFQMQPKKSFWEKAVKI